MTERTIDEIEQWWEQCFPQKPFTIFKPDAKGMGKLLEDWTPPGMPTWEVSPWLDHTRLC